FYNLTLTDQAGNPITQLNGNFSTSASNATDILYCDPNTRQWVNITVNRAGGNAVAVVNHLTLFAIVNDPAGTGGQAPPAAAQPAAPPAAPPPAGGGAQAGGAAPATGGAAPA